MTFAPQKTNFQEAVVFKSGCYGEEAGCFFCNSKLPEKGKCEPSYKVQKTFNDFCEKHHIGTASGVDN